MAWKCVADGSASEDMRKDHKTAKHIERYAISEQAIYFEGKYLPLSRIQSVRVQPSSYFPAHSCGKGLPVFKIRIEYGGEEPEVLMFEKESNAEKAVSLILSANPGAVREEYVDPVNL